MKTKSINNSIKLRMLKMTDKQQLATLLNNKKIWDNMRDIIPFPYTEKDAEAFIEIVKGDAQQQVFAIEFNSEFCGIISLILQKDIYIKSAEIGYWIGEPFWNRGITSKAVALMTQLGFEKYNINRIFAGVFEYNIASTRVLEKNGYVREGLFKKAILKNGKMWDEYIYAILND